MLTLWSTLIVVLSDQLSKLWIRGSFIEEQTVVIVPGLVNITYIRNRGGAFGILPNQPLLFLLLSVVTISAIIYFYERYRPRGTMFRIAIGLVLGGAVGNLIDRLPTAGGGYVTDWIDLHLYGLHWPAFNLADSAISVGVFLLLYIIFFRSARL